MGKEVANRPMRQEWSFKRQEWSFKRQEWSFERKNASGDVF